MIDLIKFRPHKLFLTTEAAGKVERFTRSHHTNGQKPGGKIVQAFNIDSYPPVKVVATKTQDGRWWVSKIEAVLPSVLHGHNGRPIRTPQELWMALTIVQHIVRRVTEPEGHQRIIPGVGRHNLGYVDYVECSITVRDPGHLFLHGSHLARLKNQQTPTRIYIGQSSKYFTGELAVSIYDKAKQLREGFVDPSGVEVARIEVIVRDDQRLGKDVKATKLYAGDAGEVVATMTPETSFAVLRANLLRMSGFGWSPVPESLDGLGKNARILACGLGDRIGDSRHVKRALAAYRHNVKPKANTYRKVELELRGYAVRTVIPDPLAIVPENLADLSWVDVQWPARELDWSTLLRDIGAPTEPDPAIVAAWSQTTMLRKKPIPAELIGSVAHSPPPFRKDPILT